MCNRIDLSWQKRKQKARRIGWGCVVYQGWRRARPFARQAKNVPCRNRIGGGSLKLEPLDDLSPSRQNVAGHGLISGLLSSCSTELPCGLATTITNTDQAAEYEHWSDRSSRRGTYVGEENGLPQFACASSPIWIFDALSWSPVLLSHAMLPVQTCIVYSSKVLLNRPALRNLQQMLLANPVGWPFDFCREFASANRVCRRRSRVRLTVCVRYMVGWLDASDVGTDAAILYCTSRLAGHTQQPRLMHDFVQT
nr:hypothetical protein CFP56_13214 [Quercus suber]